MGNTETARKNLKKAHKSPKIGKRGKSAITIAKENARKVFEEAQLKQWELISAKQAKDALKDRQSREYTINQVIGKPKETVEHTGEVGLKLDV